MKRHPYNHDSGEKEIIIVVLFAAALALAFALTSCTVTTSPDGTTTRQPDYNAWLEITRLILTDEVPKAIIAPSK